MLEADVCHQFFVILSASEESPREAHRPQADTAWPAHGVR